MITRPPSTPLFPYTTLFRSKDLGYRIKLVASAERSADGVLVRVHPSLAPLNHPLAQAGGALNALFIEGTRIGRIFVQGDRKSTRLNSSHVEISYAVFCLKKK